MGLGSGLNTGFLATCIFLHLLDFELSLLDIIKFFVRI